MSNTGRTSRNILSLDPRNYSTKDIQQVVDTILHGGTILYPTDTIYGIGCDALNEKAVAKVYRLKQRSERKPMLVLVNSIEMAELLVKEIKPQLLQLMRKCWPGPLTLLFPPNENTSPWLSAESGKIGIRYPRHDFCLELIRRSGRPVLSTSANISGKEYTNDIQQLRAEFAPLVDLIVDAGTLPGSPASTVVDISEEVPVLIREGAFSKSELVKIIGRIA